MCWTFDSIRIAIALVAIELLAASPITAQANLERIVGTAAGVRVQQAGVPAEAAPTIGMLLQPGDILRADKTASVELRCTTKGAKPSSLNTVDASGRGNPPNQEVT